MNRIVRITSQASEQAKERLTICEIGSLQSPLALFNATLSELSEKVSEVPAMVK